MKCSMYENVNWRKDCFAHGKDGECIILRNTRFMRDCPYYKRKIRPSVEFGADITFDGHEGTFRPIAGYYGIYWVSDLGEVVNKRGKPKKVTVNGTKSVVTLCKDGICKTYSVAKLVGDTWIDGTGRIYRIDDDPLNNRLDNLERR